MKTLLVAVFLAYTACAAAQQDEDPADIHQLAGLFGFSDYDLLLFEEPAEILLEFDTRTLKRKKYKEEYQDALLGFRDENGSWIKKKIRIRARGEYRKKYCEFPPLRISFRAMNDTAGATLPSIKLVTHCKYSRVFEQYVLREYLVYRMYNLVSEFSYRVRLLRVTYRDINGRGKDLTRLAMIIEPDSVFENRLNGKMQDEIIIGMAQLHYESTNRLSLFQFLIGNTDWQITPCHNIKIFFPDSTRRIRPVPVPYDFDYSGMVNAFYAIPREELGIGSVTERVYLGYCIFEDEYFRFFDSFNILRDDLYKLISRMPLLDDEPKFQMTRYLDGFYEILGNENKARQEILNNCVRN